MPPIASAYVPQRYWLANNVYVAATHDSAIFLDLRRDRYFGLNGLSTQLLAEILHEFPAPATTGITEQQRLEIIQSLSRDGLIASSRSNDTIQSVLPSHHCGLVAADQGTCSERKVTGTNLVNFLAACARANLQLRFQALETIVRGVTVRKRQATSHGSVHTTEKTISLTGIFRALRPLAFSADGRCLFHALALVHFLARYGAFPTWVIGVRSTPFAAHSWVQDGDVILDATPEHIAPYTPILGI